MSRYNYCFVFPLVWAETDGRSEFGERRWWRWSGRIDGCLRLGLVARQTLLLCIISVPRWFSIFIRRLVGGTMFAVLADRRVSSDVLKTSVSQD
jgi:hypothetical protein